MKIFVIILILILNFQPWTKASEITELEIEGISVGESLLDFFDKSEIDENKIFQYKSNRYVQYVFDLNNSQYDDMVIEFENSGNYIIGSIIGRIKYLNNDFYKCSNKEKNILSELKIFFKDDADYYDRGLDTHEADPSGESKGTWHVFKLKDESGIIYLECLDWSKKFNAEGYSDELKLTIFNKKFLNFLNNEAY
tara:strand:- start:116 stop:700 length:585 start_codon:yes stop_codon:yes gene_type:complete